MQEPRSASTLELVVNEQQLQNMSQIDLSRTTDNQNRLNDLSQQQQQQSSQRNLFSFEELKKWPARFCEGFSAKLNEAKSKSDTKTEFVFEVMQAFSGIVIWVLCFLCTIIVPIVLFFIGLINLDSCADRPSLPYLIFANGFIMSASNLFNLALALDLPVLTNQHTLSTEVKNIIASIVNIIFNCVVAFLYIIIAYMVYTMGSHKSRQDRANEEEVIDSDLPIDCNGTLYYFSYWFVTITLSLFVILCLLAGVFFAYNRYRLAIIRGSTPRSQATPNNPNLPSYQTTSPN